MAKVKAKYSPATGGVYLLSVYAEFPDDAVDIQQDLYEQFCNVGGRFIYKDGVLTLGSVIIPTDPMVPMLVSRAQGKAALIQSGLWPQVLSYVESITDPTAKALAEVALNDTTEWRRDSPFLTEAATAIGLTQADLDQLFISAAEIQL